MKRIFIFLFVFFSSMCVNAHRSGIYFYFDAVEKHVYEDENVKVFLLPTSYGMTSVCVQNKTNKVIYVDNGASFFYTNGKAENMYKAMTTTHGTSFGTGVAFNLGGLARATGAGGVLGSILNSMTVSSSNGVYNGSTIAEKRIIPIAPNSTEPVFVSSQSVSSILTKMNFLEDSEDTDKMRDVLVSFWQSHLRFNERGKGLRKMKRGTIRTYTQSNSLLTYKAFVKYSFTESMDDVKDVQVENYLKSWAVDSHKGINNYEYARLRYCDQFRENEDQYTLWMRQSDGCLINYKQCLWTLCAAVGILALISK